MRSKSRINIVIVPCKRCGKSIAMTNRSIYGDDRSKAQYEGICEPCSTLEERAEILQRQSAAILRKTQR